MKTLLLLPLLFWTSSPASRALNELAAWEADFRG
jgi:hypothetical protein